MKISFVLNGKQVSADVTEDKKLIDILRDDFGLIGTKKGCEKGECGLCLVLLDKNLVNSCLIPAFRIEGSDIQTIEGLIQKKNFSIIEEAFNKIGATICGYCSSGIIMVIEDLISHNTCPTNQEIKDALSGNSCRCNGYRVFIDIVKEIGNIMSKKKNGKKRKLS